MLYRVLQKTFIEPNLYEQGSVISYSGPPGPHLVPVDDEAKAKTRAWAEENPGVSLRPFDQLPLTMENVPQASLVSAPGRLAQEVAMGNLAQPGKAVPGPTEGGPPALTEELLAALHANGFRPAGGPGLTAVTPDPPGIGTNAPTVNPGDEGYNVSEASGLPGMSTIKPPGDASKPGENAEEDAFMEKKREADLNATDPGPAPTTLKSPDPDKIKVK